MYQLLKDTLLFMIVCDLVAIAKASAYVLCDCVARCCDRDDGLAFPGLCNPKIIMLPRRAVRGRPARRNVEEQELPNAPKV
uniref:Secreted protein n=1 Tax=Solanum tuberosum TaxID=4113 RepID=M1DIJ1_SOLTU